MYWCSVVALAILGLIIGVLTQIWLEKRWWHMLVIVIPAVFIVAGIFFSGSPSRKKTFRRRRY
ncbi:hypothetical protein JCM18909_2637 [Cutibacterium acnes JCM 18909]|nr:hypothetical protein JCM18909_2637 [Cutibacterium acnes JCM 18909]